MKLDMTGNRDRISNDAQPKLIEFLSANTIKGGNYIGLINSFMIFM